MLGSSGPHILATCSLMSDLTIFRSDAKLLQVIDPYRLKETTT